MAPAEIRAWLASVFEFKGATTSLTERISFASAMSRQQQASVPAIAACPIHPGVAQLRRQHPGGFLSLHSSFVDDTGNAGYRDDMASVVTQSVLSAYVIFGFPGSDRWGNRPDVITASKWQDHVSQSLRYLGFDVDVERMLVRWPYAKRLRLASALDLLCQDALPLREGKSVQLHLVASFGFNSKWGFGLPQGAIQCPEIAMVCKQCCL
jgi:hypothetical protein